MPKHDAEKQAEQDRSDCRWALGFFFLGLCVAIFGAIIDPFFYILSVLIIGVGILLMWWCTRNVP